MFAVRMLRYFALMQREKTQGKEGIKVNKGNLITLIKH